MPDTDLSLSDFAERVGTSPRNVRYLLAEEVLPRPGDFVGRLVFRREHVEAYEVYRTIEETCGLSAKQIGALAKLPEDVLAQLPGALRRIAELRNASLKEPV